MAVKRVRSIQYTKTSTVPHMPQASEKEQRLRQDNLAAYDSSSVISPEMQLPQLATAIPNMLTLPAKAPRPPRALSSGAVTLLA
jgi:hypothetical protein